MTYEEIKAFLHKQPFRPFRIHLSDRRSFDIRHPDFAWVLKSRIEVGVSDDPNSTTPDRAEFVSLLHLVSLEELKAA